MAGIGFALRKLSRRDDLLGVVEAYGHAALASTGPWLFTILSLSGIALYGPLVVSYEELTSFQTIIIYNFSFSLVLSAPVIIVVTRLVADMFCAKDVRHVPAVMLSGVGVLLGTQALVAGPFYLMYVDLSRGAQLAALANSLLLTGIFFLSLFLTALKDYGAITSAFAVGMLLAMVGAVSLAADFSLTGMLMGFNVGLAYIMFSVAARVLAEYPYRVGRWHRLGPSLVKHWKLALGGLTYSAAIWVDKWLMWFAPQRVVLDTGMFSYPDHDSAMFLAYLTIVPSMAVFVFHIETGFFEKYTKFYRELQGGATYERIVSNHADIIRTLWDGARTVVTLQGGICVAAILLAPWLFDMAGIGFVQLAMFRFGVLGAFFHLMFLIIMIVLNYFGLSMAAIVLASVFLVTNAGFTYVCIVMGFPYYGYGYFLSALVSCSVACCVAATRLGELPYQAFIRGNSALR